jgi:hypothetical protein
MKRWIGLSLITLSLLSTGCVASARFRYQNDYRHRHADGYHDGRYDYRR